MAHPQSYSASKFALDGLTVALAAEHSADALSEQHRPGFHRHGSYPPHVGRCRNRGLGVQGAAKRLARLKKWLAWLLWLASEENTLSRDRNIAIDGGFTRV